MFEGITAVGLDADDTLWHSENRFVEAHERYHALLSPYVDLDSDALEARMLATERRNLRLFGYGAKGFTLSLIETAIEVTDRRVSARDIEAILRVGKDLLDHPVELLPGVEDTVGRLERAGLRLLLVTKGDLWHQESKVAASGIADLFEAVEIVAEKDDETYARILDRYAIDPGSFCMVGNSVRSDILPVVRLGGVGVHVPYQYLWAHEAVDEAEGDRHGDGWVEVGTIADLPGVLGLG